MASRSGNRSDEVAVSTQEKRLCDVRLSDAANQRAAASAVEGQNPQQILEAPRNAIGAVVFLGVGIAQLASRGDHDVLAGLHIDSRVGPKLLAGDLHFLGDAALAGQRRLLTRDRQLRRGGREPSLTNEPAR